MVLKEKKEAQLRSPHIPFENIFDGKMFVTFHKGTESLLHSNFLMS